VSLIYTLTHPHHKKETGPTDTKKWAKFTYVGKETRFITKLFKESTVRASFTTNNTITKILNIRTEQHTDQYDNSGVYQLTCPDCQMRYIGQTGRSSKLRYSEHFRNFKYSNKKSKFLQHLLEQKHSIGPIHTIMKILHKTNKGKSMDTIEKCHIYKETRINNQINDKNTVRPNVIFDTIVQNQYEQGAGSSIT
jgi:hypothetical protein